jgi:hypothetical protein
VLTSLVTIQQVGVAEGLLEPPPVLVGVGLPVATTIGADAEKRFTAGKMRKAVARQNTSAERALGR